MPRTIAPEITAALASGRYTPYFRLTMGDGTNTYIDVEPIYFKLERLSFEARFTSSERISDTLSISDVKYAILTRGVTISGVNYSISTSKFYTLNGSWDGKVETIYARIFPNEYFSTPGDVTYQEIIETVCATYGKTASFQDPAADWLDYQFLPTGRTLTFNNPQTFFSLLLQKYLIYACDNGDDELLFASIPDIPYNPTTLYTLDEFTFSDFATTKRRFLWRDENNTIHYSGASDDPIHNLGFLSSGSNPPGTNQCYGRFGAYNLPINLDILSFDSVDVNNTARGYGLAIQAAEVTELLDKSRTSKPWNISLNYFLYFSNTEGGALPSTIEAAAPYTPLATIGFNKNLSSSVNNLQALADAVDDLPISRYNVTLLGY